MAQKFKVGTFVRCVVEDYGYDDDDHAVYFEPGDMGWVTLIYGNGSFEIRSLTKGTVYPVEEHCFEEVKP
jgi:hypothetical protein